MITNNKGTVRHQNFVTATVMIPHIDEIRMVDSFQKAKNGDIRHYRLFEVFLPNRETKATNRKLNGIWLAINMDSKWNGGANDDRSEANPVRNTNPAVMAMILKGFGYNAAVISGTITPWAQVPRPSWGASPKDRKAFLDVYKAFGDIIIQEQRGTAKYKENLAKCAARGNKYLETYKDHLEPNNVIYVEDNGLCPIFCPDHLRDDSNYVGLDRNTVLSQKNAPITWLPMINSFHAFIDIDRTTKLQTLPNGTELHYGLREVRPNVKACSFIGSVFNSRKQASKIRTSFIDIVRKQVTEAPKAELSEEQVALDKYHNTDKGSSRAETMHRMIMEDSRLVEIRNATLKVNLIGDIGKNSAQVEFEASIDENSEWYLVQDNSIASRIAARPMMIGDEIINDANDINDILNTEVDDIDLPSDEEEVIVNSLPTKEVDEIKAEKEMTADDLLADDGEW